MTSEPASPPNKEPAVPPHSVLRAVRPWLGSAALLSGGVLVIVVLLIGRAVMHWWKGEGSAFAETFATCLFLVVGLAAFLSIWWVANKIEQRFRSDAQAKTEPAGVLQELKGCLFGSVSLPVVFLMMALAGRGPQQTQQSFHRGGDTDKQVIWMSPEAIKERVQRKDATLRFWNIAVTNLHSVRFQTPSGQELAEKYYERMFQQLRQQSEAAKRASTVNVDADLVQMVARQLAVEDELLQLRSQLDEFMKNEKLAPPTDSVDQRMALTKLLAESVQANPAVLEKIPPGPIGEWIKTGLRVEEQRQEQLRDIELMQAVLQERYKGTSFPLPTIAP
ncbi:MAG: hypothetical protein JWP89_397 [Schlesneria sp.]|nr:hypothetical protein [Schlesneria sp.]